MIEIVEGELERCLAIRREVFMGEQNVTEAEEMDGRDGAPTVQVLAVVDGVDCGCARILYDAAARVHLGRVAVRRPFRGQGIGMDLVNGARDVALRHFAVDGTLTITLDAQEYAIGFYERAGYTLTERERFLDAGIWHREMAQTITR
ncbi:GNAT family N-acetyltransferase [Neoactinobaculum massilliense]|uniref:GNAT family N-acetyltransferase n=1 Tax=Neoactinobaculum massilliense TaxID=2364794 RepID=UPI000F51E707|nr:GNAT family N-acetyltransferase [Neoactinobaculum massilliense]